MRFRIKFGMTYTVIHKMVDDDYSVNHRSGYDK